MVPQRYVDLRAVAPLRVQSSPLRSIQPVTPMKKEDNATWEKDRMIFRASIRSSFFLRKKDKRKKLIAEARELARARPECLRGPMRTRLRRRFEARPIMAILTGVFVFCKA